MGEPGHGTDPPGRQVVRRVGHHLHRGDGVDHLLPERNRNRIHAVGDESLHDADGVITRAGSGGDSRGEIPCASSVTYCDEW